MTEEVTNAAVPPPLQEVATAEVDIVQQGMDNLGFDGVQMENIFEENELPDVGLAEIRDGVVSERTRANYVAEIFALLMWLRDNVPTVLTDECQNIIRGYEEVSPNLPQKRLLFKNRIHFSAAIRNADQVPLIIEARFYPGIYMNYLRTLRNSRTRGYLSKSAYGVKRSALFHLFRLHNGNGYSEAFKMQLSNLYRGFFRCLVQNRRNLAQAAIVASTQRDDDATVTTSGVPLLRLSKFFSFFFLK